MTLGMFITGLVLVAWVVALVLTLALCRVSSRADRALGYKDEEDDPC